ILRKEVRGPAKEVCGSGNIPPLECPSTAGRQILPGPAAQLADVSAGWPHVPEQSVRLLEVIPDDLLSLIDPLTPAIHEPTGVSLMQPSSSRLRHLVVGGVADQQVPEAVSVGDRSFRSGTDELLPH